MAVWASSVIGCGNCGESNVCSHARIVIRDRLGNRVTPGLNGVVLRVKLEPMPPVSAIREQLDKILNSQAFGGSDQLKRLLRVSVERTLDGQTHSTKEYTLGVEALRPAGWV